jgi:predicted GH43/DUF377 family glycosyl hydrolase
MIEVEKKGILIEKTDLGFEKEGVLNPATIKVGDDVHLFYRAVSKNNFSTLGYCKLKGPLTVEERSDTPILSPQAEYESHGIEDPRITKIDNLYYLTYTAYDGTNALGALATSSDLIKWDRLGLICPQITFLAFDQLANSKQEINERYLRYNQPQYSNSPEKQVDDILLWDKDVIFFPRRINGKLHFLHRIKPDIQIVAVSNLDELTPEFWQDYFLHLNEHIVLTPKCEHEASYVGGGCPPIETEYGWLLIYHSVQDTSEGYVYSASAALLDLENPQKEIARLPFPLFKPEHDWELKGVVNNVCFPTGTALFGDTLYIYYGSADERIACASLSLSALLKELLLYVETSAIINKPLKHSLNTL